MAEKYLIGIDVGTSGVKVLAVAEDGRIVKSAVESYPLHVPRAGWTEQDPVDWWHATIKALERVMPVCAGHKIAAVGLSGQMHGMVALDDRMQVVRPAILWNDQRTERQCRELTELAGGPAALLAMTNNQMLTGYTGGKIRWLQQVEPDNYQRVRLILNPKDYIRWCLTGTVCTDVSDASGTGFYDVKNNRWHEQLLSLAGIDRTLFPPVVESTATAGRVHGRAAAATGLPIDTPVSGGGGDAVISTTGLGLIKPGRIGITLGTSGVVAMGAPAYMANPDGKLQVFRGNAPGQGGRGSNTSDSPFERVTVKVRLRCEMEHFGPLLYGLESGSPQLFVSELTITGRRAAPGGRARSRNQPANAGYLDIAFDMYGYLRRAPGGGA